LSQGVPQGSVLSPLLFSLYIAGIEKIISRRCEVGLFADDIVLWNSNSDVVHIETAINTTLSDIQIFAEQHKLIFNVSKSTSSFFTTNRRLYNYQPQVFMESKSLLYEKHPKYLGYILDPEILSNKHIDYVINKGRKGLGCFDAGTLRLDIHLFDQTCLRNYGRLLRLTPGIIGRPQVVPLSIKADRVVQTTISRLASGHIRGLSFNLGQKIYENCTKCNLVQATPDHLLFCAGLEREDIYSRSSFGVRFPEDSWAHGPGLACG
ncbi:uncharacterized protein TNCV_5090911, partial [Trichonephila clavipes]